jgi:diacylglycerol O-acyltransferase-1
MNKFAAQLFVFFVSALAHEVVVSGPLCTFNILQLHSFYGMMVQPLFVAATMRMQPRAGNTFFWVTIMIGQPLGVIFYYRDYVSRYGF